MQIRELNLKELDTAYELVKQLRSELSYIEFEDLIYDMRHIDYKMLGVFIKDKLVTYAGVAILTNLYHKRHLYVFDLVTDENLRNNSYGESMLSYLVDYAKIGMCENIVLSSGFEKDKAHNFYEKNDYKKKSFVFIKKV